MNPRTIFIATVAILAIATGVWLSYRVASTPAELQPRAATLLSGANTLGEFALLDHTGAPAGPDTFKGQWDLVFFGFTHCPDICPMTLQVLSAARQQMAEQGLAPLPRIVLVSVDPERDTPDLLASYVAYFGDDNLGLTGELDEVRKLTDALGIFFDKRPLADGNYTVDHSSAVLLFDPAGEFRALFGAPHEIENYVHDLPIITGSR
jgi:protein SCO1/2